MGRGRGRENGGRGLSLRSEIPPGWSWFGAAWPRPRTLPTREENVVEPTAWARVVHPPSWERKESPEHLQAAGSQIVLIFVLSPGVGGLVDILLGWWWIRRAIASEEFARSPPPTLQAIEHAHHSGLWTVRQTGLDCAVRQAFRMGWLRTASRAIASHLARESKAGTLSEQAREYIARTHREKALEC